MRKIISRFKIIIIAAIIALIVVFFYVPFILISSPVQAGMVNPCLNTGQFAGLCSFTSPITLYSYLQNHNPIDSINWKIPIVGFIIIFSFTYGIIKLIIFVIRFPREKHKLTILVLKVVAIAAIFCVVFFVGYNLLDLLEIILSSINFLNVH